MTATAPLASWYKALTATCTERRPRAEPTEKGTVFKITPQGVLTTLYSFCAQTNCPDGSIVGATVQGSG